MKPHPRIRKTIKWGGGAVTVLLAVLWLWSKTLQFSWIPAGGFGIEMAHGCLLLDIPCSYRARDHHPPSLRVESAYWFTRRDWWKPRWDSDGWWTRVLIPIWLPAVVMCSAAMTAWRLDTVARRRARVGHCTKCGYDRAGIAGDAKCPECGASSTAAP